MGKVGIGRAQTVMGYPDINVGHPGTQGSDRSGGEAGAGWLEQVLAGCCEYCLLSSLHPHTALSIVLQIHTAQGSVREPQPSTQTANAR